MIDSKECNDYAQLIFSRGEITQEEIGKLVIDRHSIDGCYKGLRYTRAKVYPINLMKSKRNFECLNTML